MNHPYRFLPLALAVMTVLCMEACGQGVRGFGTPEGKLPILGFGDTSAEERLRRQFPELAVQVNEADRQKAIRDIKRADKNGDWILDAAEMNAVGYSFELNDLNRDGRVPLWEMILRHAQARVARHKKEQSRGRQSTTARITSPWYTSPTANAELQAPAEVDPLVRSRQRQARDLAAYVMQVYDVNGDRNLERTEFRSQITEFGNLAASDVNADGTINREELSNWMLNRLPPLLSSQLAVDFQERDRNNDGQVSLREYAPLLTPDIADEFNRWDRNGDGFITPQESISAPESTEKSYTNSDAMVIRSNSAVVSQIWVEDDVVIDDLNVRVSITKENDNFLDLHLIDPKNRRLTLYTGGWQPWRGAYIFENTLIDDQAAAIRKTLSRPPYPRALQPPGAGAKGQLSLSMLNGFRTRGVWRLVVRSQDDRTGVLKSWSLIVKPRDKSAGSAPSRKGGRK